MPALSGPQACTQWWWMFPHHLRAIVETPQCFFSVFSENTCKCTLVMTVVMVSSGLGCTTTAARESNRLLLTPALSKLNSGLFQCHCCQPPLVTVQQHCVTMATKRIHLIQDRRALLKLARPVGGGQQVDLLWCHFDWSLQHQRAVMDVFFMCRRSVERVGVGVGVGSRGRKRQWKSLQK